MVQGRLSQLLDSYNLAKMQYAIKTIISILIVIGADLSIPGPVLHIDGGHPRDEKRELIRREHIQTLLRNNLSTHKVR